MIVGEDGYQNDLISCGMLNSLLRSHWARSFKLLYLLL